MTDFDLLRDACAVIDRWIDGVSRVDRIPPHVVQKALEAAAAMPVGEVGSLLTWPPEPPLGAVIECRDSIGPYRIERLSGGWRLVGSCRHFDWETVCRTFLPGKIVELP